MKLIRYISWALIAVIVAVSTWVFLTKNTVERGTKLGAPFSLITSDGSKITDQDLLGRPHLVFFGFTNCPEVCPTTLFEISNWLEQLGDDGDALGVYFITVDPQRDTPAYLANYLTAFDPQIVGVTGTAEEIDKAAKGYHMYYRKVALEDGDYTMDHTSSILMMKADGSFMGTIAWQEQNNVVIQKLRRLLNS